MRWKLAVKAETKEYSKRTVEKYAWLPKTLDDNYRVWLEKYFQEETYYIWNRRGRWRGGNTWGLVTEQKNMLKTINGKTKW